MDDRLIYKKDLLRSKADQECNLRIITVLSYLDPRLRGDDKLVRIIVIPAKLVPDSDRGAGIQVKCGRKT